MNDWCQSCSSYWLKDEIRNVKYKDSIEIGLSIIETCHQIIRMNLIIIIERDMYIFRFIVFVCNLISCGMLTRRPNSDQ